MWPDAPSPNSLPTCNWLQGTDSRAGYCGSCQPRGLPDKASQARRGKSVSHAGNCASWLAASRMSSSRCACARLSGKARNWLPASISFCSAGRSPNEAGKVDTALSVNISQRSPGGKDTSGTCSTRQALKPTTCSEVQSPNTSGSTANGLSEQKITLSRCRRGKSCGRLLS